LRTPDRYLNTQENTLYRCHTCASRKDYEWRPAKLNKAPTSSEYRIIKATESDSGGYRCRGKGGKSWTEWSEIITLSVSCKFFSLTSKNLKSSFSFTVKRVKHIRVTSLLYSSDT
uniref:Ig-like domain-containing protein n=1 Tax=Amphilophus citrinellus TaxID=61819 RepID=A0A3Q0QYF5_AMPCI